MAGKGLGALTWALLTIFFALAAYERVDGRRPRPGDPTPLRASKGLFGPLVRPDEARG